MESQDALVATANEGDTDKVNRLQRLLITSFEGRAAAVRKVVTNSGGKTPGVDKVK
jgi:hypothetical protein